MQDSHVPVKPTRIEDLPSAVVFIIMRHRCMHNADISALYYLYRILQEGSHDHDLKKQLKKEYGKPFEQLMRDLDANTPPPAPAVSAKDIETGLDFLKQAGRFQEEMIDYIPGDIEAKKTVHLAMLVGSKAFFALNLPTRYTSVGRTQERLVNFCQVAGRLDAFIGYAPTNLGYNKSYWDEDQN